MPSRFTGNEVIATVVLVACIPQSSLASDRPGADLSDMQGLATWIWSDYISWRDDPAIAHPAWLMGGALALQSMRAGYEALHLDDGPSESESHRSPAAALGWIAVCGPVSGRLSASLGWYRTNGGRVTFPRSDLAQRFVFDSALWSRDLLIWNLGLRLTRRFTMGVDLGLERLAMEQSQILWPGDSKSRPAADHTFDLPVRMTLSGYRAVAGLGLAWSGPRWLRITASAQVLSPIRLQGDFSLMPTSPTVVFVPRTRTGRASMELGASLRARIRIQVKPPYSIMEVGANVEGPGYPNAPISLDEIVVTGPAGSGMITQLPPVWQPDSWTWFLHATMGARLDQWGLRILAGFSATNPTKPLCGKFPQDPDFRTGLSLLARIGPAAVAAGFAHQWTRTECDHAFPAAFNPSGGPTRGAREQGRFLQTDLATIALVLPIP